MRLSRSREPFSRWSAFNCFPALIHMLETWPSKVNLLSMSMPSTFIVSEDGRETFSAVTFNSISSMLLLGESDFNERRTKKHRGLLIRCSWICGQNEAHWVNVTWFCCHMTVCSRSDRELALISQSIFLWSWQIYLVQKFVIMKMHSSKGSQCFGAGYILSVRVQNILIFTCALKPTTL